MRTRKLVRGAAMLLSLSAAAAQPAIACTRAVYIGSDDVVVTGRSMDWSEDMRSNLWSFPRGLKRVGAAGPKSIKWTSKYGSVAVSSYEAGTADGMNEKGFVANLLYLAESDYGAPEGDEPLLSASAWAQYALDNFATVAEAVDVLGTAPFRLVAPTLPNGAPARLHLAVSDATGDSAIFEYVGGQLAIHHGKQYPVVTNSPQFDDQLALNAYWRSVGGESFLPGTIRAADRFVRASYLIGALPKTAEPSFVKAAPARSYVNQAIAGVLGVIRSVSVPLGLVTPGQPNIASTLWRTVADQKNKVYFFDSATSPDVFWAPLSELDLKEGAPVRKLTTAGGAVYSGNAAGLFRKAQPFAFLAASPK